jgi:squalene synthase HpnC
VRALVPVVAECGIPPGPFLDLIRANRQDQVVTRYKDFEDLTAYCRLSANPVGRIVLYIFGVASARRARLSDSICTALQIVEHLQDVAEDLRNGRVYLPLADMEEFGCDEADLAAQVTPARLRALISYEARRASSLLDEGAPLIATLRGPARLAVAGYVAGGRAALDAIGTCGGDVLRVTPRPAKRALAGHLVRAYAERR